MTLHIALKLKVHSNKFNLSFNWKVNLIEVYIQNFIQNPQQVSSSLNLDMMRRNNNNPSCSLMLSNKFTLK